MASKTTSFFGDLEGIVHERRRTPNSDSYTAKLFAAGSKRIAQKVGEEGIELALAAATQDTEEVVNEAADLMYHVIVLLADQGLSLKDVSDRLRERHSAAE